MTAESVAVFFYGLFMDASLLASKGVNPSRVGVGYIDGYGLRIGRRATLVPEAGKRAYGVLMTIRMEDLNALYSHESVVDYIPETVSVALPDGSYETAVCYTLPPGELQGTNPEYARALLELAGRLALPDSYLREIRKHLG